MKVIFISGKHGHSKTISLGQWARKVLSLCLLGVAPLSVGGLAGYYMSSNEGSTLDQHALSAIKEKHDKERWITGKLTKVLVHKMRSEEMGILVGKNTVLTDNPSLTTRNYPGKNPVRIVIDKELQLWERKDEFSVFNKNAKTIIINSRLSFKEGNIKGFKIDFDSNFIDNLLTKLYYLSIQSLIVEGGKITLSSFINEGIWDEAFVFENEKTFGSGVSAPSLNIVPTTSHRVGNDCLTVYKNNHL